MAKYIFVTGGVTSSLGKGIIAASLAKLLQARGLKVTIQDLGWRSEGRYLPQQSDISSVVFWYQRKPHARFPKLPSKNDLEIN